MSDTDYDIQELEEQDWTLGGEERKEVLEFRGMEFLVQDPDEDAILDMMAPTGDDDGSQRLFQLVSEAVVAPEVDIERWRELRTADRLALGMRVAESIGLNQLMDFQDAGLEAQQDD